MTIKCMTGFEGGAVPSNVTIVNGVPAVGFGRRFRQRNEPDFFRWGLTKVNTSAPGQADCIVEVSDTLVNKVFGSFSLYAVGTPYGDPSEGAIITFGSVKIWLSLASPTAKNLPDISAGGDVLSVLKQIGWVSSLETDAILSESTYGAYTGANGGFRTMALEVGAGDILIKPRKYYVGRINSTFVPYMRLNVQGTPTTYTGTNVGTIETAAGTADLFEIDVLALGTAESSETTPFHIGPNATDGAAGVSDLWFPFRGDPRDSSAYELTIDDGLSTGSSVLTLEGVNITKGYWTNVRFNIDLSDQVNTNAIFVEITDTVNTYTLNKAMSGASLGGAGQVRLKSRIGTTSVLDDIRIEDDGTLGTPPAIVRCEYKMPSHAFKKTVTDTVAVVDVATTLTVASFCAAPDGYLYAVDATNVLWKIDPDTYDSTNMGAMPISPGGTGSTYCMHLYYHEKLDKMYGVTLNNITEVDYKALVPAGGTTVGKTLIPTTGATGGVMVTAANVGVKGVYLPQKEAIYLVTSYSKVIKIKSPTDISVYTIPVTWQTDTEHNTCSNRSLLYQELEDTIYCPGPSRNYIAKISLGVMESGASSAEWFSQYIAVSGTAEVNSLHRTYGDSGEAVLVSASSQSAYTSKLSYGILGDSTIQPSVSTAAVDTVYIPHLSLACNGTSYYDMSTYTFTLPVVKYIASGSVTVHYILNPFNGDILKAVGAGSALTILRLVSTTGGLNSIMARDSKEVLAANAGDVLVIKGPHSPKTNIVRNLGKNVVFKSVRGGGSLTIDSDQTSLLTTITPTPSTKVVLDYNAPDEIQPDIAWYGDSNNNGVTSISDIKNHGKLGSAITATATSTANVVSNVTIGTGSNTILTGTPNMWEDTKVIYQSILGAAGQDVKYEGAVAPSTGAFSFNIIFSVNGYSAIKNTAGQFACLFTSNRAVSIATSDTNGFIIGSTSTMNVLQFYVKYFDNASPTINITFPAQTQLTFGREAGGDIVLKINGVEILRDSTSANRTNPVNWGSAISLLGNATAQPFSVALHSFGLYLNDYVEWKYDVENIGQWSTGRSVKILNN